MLYFIGLLCYLAFFCIFGVLNYNVIANVLPDMLYLFWLGWTLFLIGFVANVATKASQ